MIDQDLVRCLTKNCLGYVPKGRRKCGKCRMREWREKYPDKATFTHLKQNAYRRDIPVELTLDEWRIWCSENNYLELRGIESDSATVDRIEEYDSKGYKMPYRLDNIQLLLKSDNCRKALVDRRTRAKKGRWWVG